MICENCRKDNKNIFVHEGHIFCSQKCKNEYYKDKKKIRCQRCGAIFYEVDLIITEGEADTSILLSYDWGVPVWYREKIKRCPNCKSINYNVKGHHFESDTIKIENSKERIFSNSFEELKKRSKNDL